MSLERAAETKLRWAGEHLAKLQELEARFAKANPFPVIEETDPLTGRKVYNPDLTIEIPPEISHELGHVVHELRSALDNLIYELALPSPRNLSGVDAPDRTCFPVCTTRPAFRKACRGGALGGLNAESVAFVESQQPFARGGEGPTAELDDLWVLHALWNIDKHRRIPLVVLRADQHVNVFATVPGDQIPPVQFGSPTFDSGQPVLSIPPHDSNVVRFEPVFAIQVALDRHGPGRGQGVVAVANRLNARVVRVIGQGNLLI